MPRRYPGVRQRKDGLWEGRYDVHIGGKRKQQAVYARTANEASSKLQQARSAAERGILPDNPTVGQYLTRWIAAKDGAVAFTTSRRYLHIVTDHLVPALGHIHLKRLSLADVNEMLAGRSPFIGATNSDIATANSAFTWRGNPSVPKTGAVITSVPVRARTSVNTMNRKCVGKSH